MCLLGFKLSIIIIKQQFCREEWITAIQQVADTLRESEKEKDDTDEISIASQKMVCQ